MRRTTIALLAALEAAVAALIGLGIVLVPLMLLWAMQYGLAVDATVFLRAAADVWLLGHGVDLTVQLDPVTAGGLGLPGAGEPFPITIALLGFALLSVAAGRRIGRRSAAGGHSITGSVAAVVVYAVVGATLAIVAGADVARASIWQATLLPAFIVAIGVAIGAVAETLREPSPTDAAGGFFRDRLGALPRGGLDAVVAAVRIGAGAAFALLAVAAVFLAVLITLDYATIAGLSQSLGAGVDGGIALVVARARIPAEPRGVARGVDARPGLRARHRYDRGTRGHAARAGSRHSAARGAPGRRAAVRRAVAARARARRVRRRLAGAG